MCCRRSSSMAWHRARPSTCLHGCRSAWKAGGRSTCSRSMRAGWMSAGPTTWPVPGALWHRRKTPDAMSSLAIIPARKGSVRLPGKNTRLLGNKPMVQWTIEAALGSACVDEVLVTSDDEEVLGIAGKLGVPHLVNRPASLAGPDTSSADVVRHALTEADVRGIDVTSICLLQPTSPLRTSAHIDEAFAMRAGPRAKPVVSVCELDHPLAWCFRLDDRQELHSLALPQVPLPY